MMKHEFTRDIIAATALLTTHLAPEPSDFAVATAINKVFDLTPAREDCIISGRSS